MVLVDAPAGPGVHEGAPSRGEALHGVLAPLRAELRAAVEQVVDDRAVPVGAQPHPGLGAELGQEAAAVALPIGQQVAQPRVGVDEPQQVALLLGDRGDRPVERLVLPVPADDRPVRGDDEGGERERLDEAVQVLRRALGRGRHGLATRLHQGEDVLDLGVRELQHAGDGDQHLLRGVDLPPLLEPGVPADADARERGDLLAAEPDLAAPAARRQTELGAGLSPPARGEELAELDAARSAGANHQIIVL